MFAEHFNASIPESTLKKEFADRLSSAILSSASDWLKTLSPYDIEIFKELAGLEAGTRVVKPLLYFPLSSVVYNFLQIDDDASTDTTNAYYMTDDVHAAISACISEVFDNDLMREFLRFQQYAYGLLALYGVLPIDLFIDEIEFFPFSSEEVVDDLTKLLANSEFLYVFHSIGWNGRLDCIGVAMGRKCKQGLERNPKTKEHPIQGF